MKRILLLIFITSILYGCKKEYTGPEVIITDKRTKYYNGGGAVLPYREQQTDTIILDKEMQDKINKAFYEIKKIEKERQIIQFIQ